MALQARIEGQYADPGGCGGSFLCTDPRLLRQYPQLVLDTFNIVAVGDVKFERDILVMLRDHVANRGGVAAFQRQLESLNKTAFFRVRYMTIKRWS